MSGDARHRYAGRGVRPEPPQLRAGKDFHRSFQDAYGLDLLVPSISKKEVEVVKGDPTNRQGRDVDGLPPILKDVRGRDRLGRVDFVVWIQPTEGDPERRLILIELKSTDWDTVKNVQRLALRHAAQIFSYMRYCWDLIELGHR